MPLPNNPTGSCRFSKDYGDGDAYPKLEHCCLPAGHKGKHVIRHANGQEDHYEQRKYSSSMLAALDEQDSAKATEISKLKAEYQRCREKMNEEQRELAAKLDEYQLALDACKFAFTKWQPVRDQIVSPTGSTHAWDTAVTSIKKLSAKYPQA